MLPVPIRENLGVPTRLSRYGFILLTGIDARCFCLQVTLDTGQIVQILPILG
jgi:hypothetical protein